MHKGELHRIEFPLAGDFQIANGLVAAGMAIATGSDNFPKLAISLFLCRFPQFGLEEDFPLPIGSQGKEAYIAEYAIMGQQFG